MLIPEYSQCYYVTNEMGATGGLVIYGVLGEFQIPGGPIDPL